MSEMSPKEWSAMLQENSEHRCARPEEENTVESILENGARLKRERARTAPETAQSAENNENTN